LFASGTLLAMLVLYPMIHSDGRQDKLAEHRQSQAIERRGLEVEQDQFHQRPERLTIETKDAGVADKKEAGTAAIGKQEQTGARYAEMLGGGAMVRIQLTDLERIETVPIEWYVRGVVAGEMPADFQPEALKAQAIAARTYIVRKLLAKTDAEGRAKADVTDSTDDQVYVPIVKLGKLWAGKDAAQAKLDRISEAVAQTKGLILTYDGAPIQASFFSTSNGYTENSEDYWSVALPYLRSVPSPWDTKVSPRYKHEATMKLKNFYKKLDVPPAKPKQIKVISRTDGRRVKELMIGKHSVSGREARERLGLQSSHFEWKIQGDTITLTSYGYGHGVGMSQYGANALAAAGNDAEQILRYYYTGAKIEQASNLPEWAERFES
jgi:stage II sporulation protein D